MAADLATELPAFELEYGDVEDAVKLITAKLAEVVTSRPKTDDGRQA